MPIQAVIFDLDDTLYPERQFAFSGFAAVARAFAVRLGDPKRSAAAMRRLFDSEHRSRVFDALLAERGMGREVDRFLVEGMIKAYREHQPAITLHSDARAALDRLSSHCQFGLITDGPAITQRNKINALRLADWIESIVLTDELGSGYGKPHSGSFEKTAARFGLPANAFVYVADNPSKDFVAPNAMGWETICVRRPDGLYRDAQAPPSGVPRHVVTSLDALDELL